MEFYGIKDEPIFTRMTSGTISSYTLLVNIDMTGQAIFLSLFKFKTLMTRGTVNPLMSSLQFKAGTAIVIKRNISGD
jgi:hypothetical protein